MAETNALDALEQLAETRSRESHGRLTKAEAYFELLTENPAIYQLYLDERPGMFASDKEKRQYMNRLKQLFPSMGLGTGG